VSAFDLDQVAATAMQHEALIPLPGSCRAHRSVRACR
jgi:hypothetical protein